MDIIKPNYMIEMFKDPHQKAIGIDPTMLLVQHLQKTTSVTTHQMSDLWMRKQLCNHQKEKLYWERGQTALRWQYILIKMGKLQKAVKRSVSSSVIAKRGEKSTRNTLPNMLLWRRKCFELFPALRIGPKHVIK